MQHTAGRMVSAVNGYTGPFNKAERPLSAEEAQTLQSEGFGLYSWGMNCVTFARPDTAPRMCVWMLGQDGFQIGLEHIDYAADFGDVVGFLREEGVGDFRMDNGVSHLITGDVSLERAIELYGRLLERFPDISYGRRGKQSVV